ncbi:MAG TPA: CoA-binding protein [Jiangellaceae bacterium]|nr:CoA-binding protein [Jiangellaceae bacterium]
MTEVRTWQDDDTIYSLLTTPATWAVVGLSANTARTAYGVSEFVRDQLGMTIVPINPRAESGLGVVGYRNLSEVPGPIDVVDCFVNSQRVGEVVDQAIEQRERLGIRAVWLQLGVIDSAAAARATDAGLDVVMDTCPVIEARRLTLPAT